MRHGMPREMFNQNPGTGRSEVTTAFLWVISRLIVYF